MMPGMPERRTHDYVRHGTSSLFAAFDIADGKAIASMHRRHRSVEWLKFLKKIDRGVLAHLQLHIVCDNYGTHKTPAVQTWLAAHPRFHVHFTPTSACWLNQVERWFALITDKLIRRGVHTSVTALEKDILAWVDIWNEDPKPFVWIKTAEEILESLELLLRRIKARNTRRRRAGSSAATADATAGWSRSGARCPMSPPLSPRRRRAPAGPGAGW